jgi:hypothetical protein
MAEGDTFVAIDDDDMVLIENEIVDKHWFSQDVFRGSRRSPGGVPLALDSDWMLVCNDQTSRKRSEILSSEGASNTSYGCSLTTRCDDLVTSSYVFSILSNLEAGSWVNNSNLAFSSNALCAVTIIIRQTTNSMFIHFLTTP